MAVMRKAHRVAEANIKMLKILVEGKQTLFFSDNAANKQWRFKEKITALIESNLQDQANLLTFSSMEVRDIAKDIEELDIAYVNKDDPTDIFSFIEVRDRSEKIGRQYIQEIIGKRISLGIDACKIISTKGFTRNAIRLANKVGIPLRLFLPESERNIKKWFSLDYIGMQSPMVSIVRCSILARVGDQIQKFESDQTRSLESNVLVSTENPGKYKITSLARVFDTHVMQNQIRREEVLSNVPLDNDLHQVFCGIEYEEPRLYLDVQESGNESDRNNICPITGLVFMIQVNRQLLQAPIVDRYKYLDATSEEMIAEGIVAETLINELPHYISLTRYPCDGGNFRLAGGFFR